MATGQISLSLSLSPTNTDLRGRDTVSASIASISGSLPANATITGGSLRFTSIAVYSTNSPYWTLTSPSDSSVVYAQTEGSPSQSAAFLRLNFVSSASALASLLAYSAGQSIGIHFYGIGNNVIGLNLKSSAATIVIDYTYSESDQYSKSTGELSTYTVPADGSSQITMTISGSNALNHRVVWTCGSASETNVLSAGTKTATLTVPLSWNNQITSATNRTATVTLYTYYGSTLIGSNSYTFTVTVPSSIVPSVGTPSASVAESPISGIYIQGNSKVKITSGSASGSYGSTISSYRFSGSSMSVSTTANNATSGVINDSGNRTYTVTVTDSRGRTASSSCTIYVYPYSSPVLNTFAASRTNTSGQPSETGTSITVTCTCSCSDLGSSRNQVTWGWQYRQVGSTTWIDGASGLASGVTSRIDGVAAIDSSYEVQITATDTLGNSSSVTIRVSIPGVTMFFKKGGLGIGIGMETELGATVKALEISPDWTVYHGDYKIPCYIKSNTAPTGRSGLIWFKPVS